MLYDSGRPGEGCLHKDNSSNGDTVEVTFNGIPTGTSDIPKDLGLVKRKEGLDQGRDMHWDTETGVTLMGFRRRDGTWVPFTDSRDNEKDKSQKERSRLGCRPQDDTVKSPDDGGQMGWGFDSERFWVD